MRMNFHGSKLVLALIVSTIYIADANVDIETAASPAAIFEALALNGDLPTPERPKYLSPTEIVPSKNGKLLFVAEQTAKRIAVLSLETKAVLGHIRLPNEVTGLAVSPDGVTLYATCSSDNWPAGLLCVVDAGSGSIMSRIPVGHGARAPVVTPDGEKLFVCNRFDNDLSVVDLPARKETGRIKMVREPYCAAVTPDGKTLVVGNLLPGDLSTDTVLISSKIALVDVATNMVTTEIRLSPGWVNVHGVAVSADGKYAFVTHTFGKFKLVGTMVDRGRGHTNNLAIIDIEHKILLNGVCLDVAMQGMANPWSVKCTQDGGFMVVAHAGSNDLSIINMQGFIDTVVARSAKKQDLQHEFLTQLELRRRVAVTTKGPRALAIVGNSVFTAGYFDDVGAKVEEFELSLSTTEPKATYTLGESQPWTAKRNGENNFYDGSLCFQKWRSCHSCHTFGRADGLNWILGGGAITAPKNTQGTVNSLWSQQSAWNGARLSAKAVAMAIELELFKQPAPDLVAPLDTFLRCMKPASSPYRVKGRLSSGANRGKALFRDAGKVDCSICHPGQLFTDDKTWNAGVADPFDPGTQWATPPLTETWRTAPYGHLGSLSLREMIENRGHSSAKVKLSAQEIDDLAAYVLSL